MVADLTRAALAALAAGVLPGYFWAVVLCRTGGFAERFAYSTLLSMASVPAVAILLAQLTGAGVSLWVAVGSVALVLGSGAFAFVVRGAASGPARPVLPQPPLAWMAAADAACLTVALEVLPAAGNLLIDVQAQGNVLSRSVAAAGMWLRQHNTGGAIITTPGMNRGITNRAVLAMGDYTGLQSYSPRRIEHPRAVPPTGLQPLIDTHQVLFHPGTCESARIIARDDVRYVVLYKFRQHANFAAFSADRTRYRPVFQDSSVVIYAPAQVPCQGG